MDKEEILQEALGHIHNLQNPENPNVTRENFTTITVTMDNGDVVTMAPAEYRKTYMHNNGTHKVEANVDEESYQAAVKAWLEETGQHRLNAIEAIAKYAGTTDYVVNKIIRWAKPQGKDWPFFIANFVDEFRDIMSPEYLAGEAIDEN